MDDSLLELQNIFRYNPETANYLIHLSSRFNYLYVATAKSGSSYVLRQLQYAETGNISASLADEPHAREESPLLSPLSDIAAFRRALSGEAFKFCFVRNPYTRALSCYLDKFQQDADERARLGPELGFEPGYWPSFWEFLNAVRKQSKGKRDIHWETQAFHLRPEVVRYSFIGRFENFGADFAKVLDILGLPPYEGNSDRHRTSARSRVKDFYGTGEKEFVEEIYAEDFEAFGYGYGLEGVI